jgi:predicted RecB family nuclease
MLSKSRFVAGLQCHKQLWWRVHEPDAPELAPSPPVRHRMEQGLEVGRLAHQYVPGGELIDFPAYQPGAKATATRDALARAVSPIYEATFIADQAYAQVDVLEQRGPQHGFGIVEVKATNRVKEEHVSDVALQVHVARRAGLHVDRAEVMHLNPHCRYPELSDLFVREDVTSLVETRLLDIPDELASQLRMLDGSLPEVAIGDHCSRPYMCPFFARCWRLPAHHVSTLYRIARRQVLTFEAQGYQTLHDLPSDLELGAIHARQVKAVTTGQIVVEPDLASAFAEFRSPLAFLDFETVSLAIPVWEGCHPWEMVPAQFSCHVEASGGRYEHHEWIAEGPGDPRPALAERVVEACTRARAVVAYYASFERDCLRHLARAVPRLASELRAVERKLVDLLPVVRNHVYHPDFGGSFSIKRVLPALVPALSYDTLQINDGETASVQLLRLMRSGSRDAEFGALRTALLAYCERDSWAMVKLLDRIRRLVTAQLELF